MADNIDVSLKNLNQELKNMDKNLADLSNDFHNMFALAVKKATQDANVDIDTFFKELAKRTKASDANKLRLVYELVDENGRPLTPSELRKKVENLTNSIKNAKSSGQNNLWVGNTTMSLDNAIDQLERYKKQLKLVTDNVRLYDQAINISNKSVGRGGGNYLTPLQKQQEAYKKILNIQQEIQRIKNRQSERKASGLVVDKSVVDAEVALIKKLEAEIRSLKRERKELAKESGVSNTSKLSKGDYAKSLEHQRQLTKEAVRHGEALARTRKNGLEPMFSTLQRLGSAFGMVFSVQGLVQFGKELVKTRGEFEMQFVALKQIIGDTDEATKLWNQTMNQALQSPFRSMQLVDYTKKLAAYRVETDKLFETTKRLADVSAGLGVDMGRLILAYGQVKAANFLRASEVRQFTEAGVNIYGKLAEYFTEMQGRMVSTAEVVDMVQKRMVSFADVEEIFRRLTDEGGEFYDMQRVQSETVKGQINKLHDAYDQMLNTIGESNQGTIKSLIEAAISLVRNWRDVSSFIKRSAVNIGFYVAAIKLMGVNWKKATVASVLFNNSLKVGGLSIKAYRAVTIELTKGMKLLPKLFYRAAGSVKAFGAVLKSLRAVWIIALIEAITYAITKLGEASRASKQLEEDLGHIQSENKLNAEKEMSDYEKLIKQFDRLNAGSVERANVISKLNQRYGTYLGFIVDEATTTEQLAEAQERVNKNLGEKARIAAMEAAEQRIQQDYIDREAELLRANKIHGDTDLYFYEKQGEALINRYINTEDARKFSDYVKSQVKNLTDEQVKLYNKEGVRLAEAGDEWVNTFFSLEGASISRDSHTDLFKLLSLYIEQEARLRQENERLISDLVSTPLEFQNKIREIDATIDKGIDELRKKEAGEEITITPDLKFKVPTDMGQYKEIFEVFKQRINKYREDLVIDLKLKEDLITPEQAANLKKQGHKLGNIFADYVNEQIANDILKSHGIQQSIDNFYDDILKQTNNHVIDWPKINDILGTINTSLIKESDIVNGLDNYTKSILGSLENQRKVMDDIYRNQEAGLYKTKEEQDEAEKLLNKAKERYSWLLKIAKLLGVQTSTKDEADSLNGMDVSVGVKRLKDASEALKKKFGETSNSFGGLILSQVRSTTPLKDVADAYHKQSEELKGLIANQKAANSADKDTIKNLEQQQQMAEFLAQFLGYVKDTKNGSGGQKDSISRLISLLKEMNSEYDKLSKSAYGYVAANNKVKESYREAFKEIFKAKYGTKGRYELDKAFTMINWDEVDTTNKQGVANAMKKLRDYMDTNDIWNYYSKEARAEIEKAISSVEVEAEIQVHARIRDDFKREMEQMFSNYDLTLELQGLKINPQQAKDLFPDFEETTIGQLQDKLEEFYQKWNTKGKDGKSLFSEEDLEAYRQMSDKIASDVLKMQKEKAKEYSKYFERELSDRAKLEMKYAEDIAFVRANISDETQRSNIEANLGKKYAEDLHELEWKSFKESDFYVEMMDDISSLPATYTKLMMAKLNEILANPQTLSPRALKEAIKAREKIMQAQIDLQPLNVMRESKTSINEAKKDEKVGAATWTKTRKNIDREITANQKEINARKGRISILETERGQLKKYEEAVEEVTNAEKTLSQTTKDWLDENEGDIGRTLSEMKTQYDTNIDRIKEIRDLQLQGNTDSTLNDELTRLQTQNATLKNQIPYVEKLVEKYSALSTVISTIQQSETGGTTMGMIESGVTSANVGEEVQQASEEVDKLEKRNATLKDWRKSFESFLKAFASFNKAQADMLGHLKDMNNAWYDTYEALGGETDVLTDAWKEFGNTLVDTITSARTLIPSMVAAIVGAETAINAAAGIIGLIAEAIQLVITLVGALAKVHDAGYEKEIQAQQKAIDGLSRAYDRLEKQIDKTLHVSDYMRTYDDSIDNIRERIQATEQQLQAERGKKDSDTDKIQEYENNIEDLYDKEHELRQKMIEDLGGIGEDNYRSWAEGFVSAWKDAFLETGDGLDALQDHFNEFLQEWFVKQATLRIAGKMLEPLFRDIDAAVDKYGVGGTDVLMSELKNIWDRAGVILPDLADKLEGMADWWGLEGEGGLSGLAAGIQGMTEERANILEAYWNSVRLYTASIDTNVAAIATALGVGSSVNTNPMLQQITLTAQHTNNILELLESVRTNNGSGNGIRVYSV